MSVELSVHGLTKVHAGQSVAALNSLDLTVVPGSCTAILGPSGSGKSTALRLIAGLDSPTAGTVRIDGHEVNDVAAENRGVGMVFQRPMLFPHMSVLDNIGFAYRAAGESRKRSRERAREYLDLVHLGDIGGRAVSEVSGGQAQRVALARSLAGSPRVLLLDEPFSALDPVLRTEMHDLVRELRSSLDQTVLLVTHDQQEAAVLADTVAVLIDGRLEHNSDIATAYTRPSTLAVSRLMGGINEIEGQWDGVRLHRSELGELEVDGVNLPAGPVVLLLRHELITLNENGVRGIVTSLRPTGFRSIAEVRVGSAVVKVELPAGSDTAVGDVVGLDIPSRARCVVGS
ncbi:MAG: ABC transporter ATP-binding protein [Rhodococcus sp. (in: high G+C Gram-positive bacteria)]|uniref:ABC transporter ATP-binding protein n=1 Tax=Rhodococcus sp. TaxID=1831 RepID=UPI002ADC5540|nr:ABC transporter ATP-binding protein [Rhodococcus sp. (in: high G+C Gram-positive bacteria)]MDZ7910664.1 ABC transporter ATP-binding protein [Rhodococcus sp. (in: high G+C Gram-positive bacteria)]